MTASAAEILTPEAFAQQQVKRRQELWSLLGDLPREHQPRPTRVISVEQGPGYTLEHLELDLNGLEPVPALLLIPERRQAKAPGLLYIHAHGGTYNLGKEELLRGRDVLPAYAPVCAELGLVTLAIDSWCFSERQHNPEGAVGEYDAFELMLWQGRVLWGGWQQGAERRTQRQLRWLHLWAGLQSYHGSQRHRPELSWRRHQLADLP
jgi:hypothetical protein